MPDTRDATPPPDGDVMPRSVVWVRRLVYAAVAVAALGALLGVAMLPSVEPQQLLVNLSGLAVYVVLVELMVRRNNWARVALGVWAILGGIVDLITVVSLIPLYPVMLELGWANSAYVVAAGGLATVHGFLLIGAAILSFRTDAATWCRWRPTWRPA